MTAPPPTGPEERRTPGGNAPSAAGAPPPTDGDGGPNGATSEPDPFNVGSFVGGLVSGVPLSWAVTTLGLVTGLPGGPFLPFAVAAVFLVLFFRGDRDRRSGLLLGIGLGLIVGAGACLAIFSSGVG